MKKLRALVVLCMLGFCSTSPASADEYVYFPTLAKEVLAGNSQAFRELLERAKITDPGEQLEELAELSSRFIRLNPVDFLQAQSTAESCFGVSFMGSRYTDDPAAKANERNLRRTALESVTKRSLLNIKQRCLSELAES
jgi:hypothetical protein